MRPEYRTVTGGSDDVPGDVPATDAPATDAPATDAPATDAPATERQKSERTASEQHVIEPDESSDAESSDAESSSALSDPDPSTPHDETFEMDRQPLSTGELPSIPKLVSTVRPRIRPVRFTLKMLIVVVLAYFLLPGVISGFNKAADEIRDVNPFLILLGFALELVAFFSYSLLTRAALGTVGESLSRMRLFRIQLSTKALSHIVPGGNAAGSVLGYRLLTLSGVSGPQAGFALATAGIGSAVVLNVIFWLTLLVSIPIRGVNAAYGSAALVGVIVIGLAAMLVLGITEDQGRAVRAVRWIARTVRTDEDRFEAAFRQIGERLEELISDRQLLRRVVFWAAANWLIDAMALWVFIRAFGGSLDPDQILVAFCLANVLAALPILPGGLGVVETTYFTALTGFGLPRSVATTAPAAYRSAQYLFPIVLGGLAYASLRVGPWKIEKRDRLARLRELARHGVERGESKIDFALRFGRYRTDEVPTPADIDPDVADSVAADVDPGTDPVVTSAVVEPEGTAHLTPRPPDSLDEP